MEDTNVVNPDIVTTQEDGSQVVEAPVDIKADAEAAAPEAQTTATAGEPVAGETTGTEWKGNPSMQG
jgi:hypothetical protein